MSFEGYPLIKDPRAHVAWLEGQRLLTRGRARTGLRRVVAGEPHRKLTIR